MRGVIQLQRLKVFPYRAAFVRPHENIAWRRFIIILRISPIPGRARGSLSTICVVVSGRSLNRGDSFATHSRVRWSTSDYGDCGEVQKRRFPRRIEVARLNALIDDKPIINYYLDNELRTATFTGEYIAFRNLWNLKQICQIVSVSMSLQMHEASLRIIAVLSTTLRTYRQ